VGDGALGFWAALRQVYPETQEQRCWVHKIANVLDKLPKRLQARARQTKGAGLAMAFKLALKAEGHWRKVNAPHLVALVRAGVRFRDGVHVVTPAECTSFRGIRAAGGRLTLRDRRLRCPVHNF
jgi:hypothetical protein